jgi:ketosteroid isomerase-like protein
MIPNRNTSPLEGQDLLDNQECDRLFCEGISNKDIEQLMGCIWDSPDFIFVSADGQVSLGADDFRKGNEVWFSQYETISLVIDDIKHIPVDEFVFAVGKATLEMTGKDGSQTKLTEIWTDVRKKINGRWVCLMDHAQAIPAAG